MPVVKQDPSVRRRHLRDVLVLGLPFAGAMVLWAAAGSGVWFWLAVALAVALGLTGLVRQERRLRFHRCPSCGAALRRERGAPGAFVTFHCRACETEWDTGLREASD